MIDIHTHILPGLDDGSDSMESSVKMAELAAEAGVTRLVATPHANQRGRFENYITDALFENFRALRREIAAADIGIDIVPGMEVMASYDVPKMLLDGKLLPINGSRYMLLEFPFSEDPGRMDELLHRLLDIRCTPVLAHPERYNALQISPEYLYDWACDGVVMQVNKGSVLGRFGTKPMELSMAMISHGIAGCVASDAHGTERRNTDMTDIQEYLTMEFSEGCARRLLSENPERILNNQKIIIDEIFPIGWEN